jgi:putative ABC transport system substrate-binding protein
VALHATEARIPVVALDLESDPVASGFVSALSRPGGDITGVFMDLPELAGKWLEILKMTVPALARVAVLWDPAAGPAQLDAARRAAQILKLTLHPVEARSTAEIEPAFRAALRERPDGMVVLTSPIFNTGRREIRDPGPPPTADARPVSRFRAGWRLGFLRTRRDDHVLPGGNAGAQDPRREVAVRDSR